MYAMIFQILVPEVNTITWSFHKQQLLFVWCKVHSLEI